MRERTVTISSTGKTFGLTGWKIGWACAPATLSHALRMVRQFTTFAVNHPLQLAVAQALERLDDYLPGFRREYAERRDLFVEGARAAGLEPIVPRGAYFTMVPVPEPGLSDVDYCRKLISERKVAAIPPSPFYLVSDEGTRYVRFCFAKKLETLRAALENLRRRGR
jgi:aspartate/methionine/tyrosine aminotransferase